MGCSMPIYEYKRPDGSTFEVLQAFADEPLTHDPNTGAPVERVLHAPAVHFKGKGFYNTDYGTRKRQREAPASGDSNGTSSSSESSSSSAEGGSTSSEGKKEAAVKPETAAAGSSG
jgi:putative FmdB family regulatory protein